MPLRIPRVVLRVGPGPTWTSGLPEDQPGWDEHAAFINAQIDRGLFIMGGTFWGRFYALGAAFFALAVVMPLWLDGAPLLFGVEAMDPGTYSLMSAVLLVTALMAGAMAARRVTGDAPLRSLRADG